MSFPVASIACACSLLFAVFSSPDFAAQAAPDSSDPSWRNWSDLRDPDWAQAGRQAPIARSREASPIALAIAPAARSEEPPALTSAAAPGPFVSAAGLLPIPEASTLALALLGTIGLAMLRRRR